MKITEYNYHTDKWQERDASVKEVFIDWWENRVSDWVKYPIYILLILTALVLLALVLVALMTPILIAQCNVNAQSFPHYYDFWGGCMVQYQDMWVPFRNVIFNSK